MPELLLETATLPPVLPDLEPVSWLISDHSNRERFLEELDPEQKIIAAEIFQSATRLEQCTGWDGETLVRCLGCPATTVGAFRDMKVERLEVSRVQARHHWCEQVLHGVQRVLLRLLAVGWHWG